jgi:alkaline phosphatase D
MASLGNRRTFPQVSRRVLLSKAVKLGVAAFATTTIPAAVWGLPRFPDYPFKLGIASGEPAADGFVLWTRLAPDPVNGGGMAPMPVPVTFEIGVDDGMRNVVCRGEVIARPETAHSVHVEVEGLEPDRPYWYRFIAGGESSPVGRTRTFPLPGQTPQHLRFAFACCQNFGIGYFNSYRQMVADDLDLILHLGDYIYEETWGTPVRPQPVNPRGLADYRTLHALYKTDLDLQEAHASCPWAVTWDDHEVQDDYANDVAIDDLSPEEFLRKRAAAYQAYFEHMPLRAAARPRGPNARLYRNLSFGDFAQFTLLDNRQYRSAQACSRPGFRGGQSVVGCDEVDDEARSMLGAEQEAWFGTSLGKGVKWKFVAQQQVFADVDHTRGGTHEKRVWTDGWDGYPANRRRILEGIRDRGTKNVVILGGDSHQHWVTDLKLDNHDRRAPILASEFSTGAITSGAGDSSSKVLADNPQVKFYDWQHRGYMRVEVGDETLRTDVMAVDSVAEREAPVRVLASFIVEDGRAGPQGD